ncbi:MAG: hypothetical protein ACK44A_09245 [Roseateles sp.]
MSASHVLRWVGARSFVAAPVDGAPTLLRFDSDDFMDRLLAMLADAPQTLPDYIARPESWQQLAAPTPAPAMEAPKSATARALIRQRSLLGFKRETPPAPPPTTLPLKLFQPVHQRFYVAAAHLVCELPGLPTRTTAGGDKSGMLLRRLLQGGGEAAFVKAPGQPGRWHAVADPGRPLPGEEWLPVFPLAYTAPGGQPRRLLAGLVPAARHDDFRFATLAPPTPPGLADTLKASARMKLIAPWQGLIERARAARDATAAELTNKPWDSSGQADASAATLARLNDQLQEASWRQLQDMEEWLAATLPQVHAGLVTGTASATQAQALLNRLSEAVWGAAERAAVDSALSLDVRVLAKTAAVNLREALREIGKPGVGAALDATEQAFPAGTGWAPFSFPLAVATAAGPSLAGPFNPWPTVGAGDNGDPQDVANRRLETLYNAVAAAIDEAVATGKVGAAQPQAPDAARLAAELQATLAADTGPPRYVLRFVHQRCDCGPLHPAVMSERSEVFELAGFFDVDAPLRPLRIALPFDTSPGGLRKYGKNSAFIMSDLLCGQMKRVRRLGFGDLVLSVLPWPFHKDLSVPDAGPCGGSGASSFGTICSLSIPIITIVAFVLLIVIATLLDLIFRWLPFLMVCFPVPGLKGKKP